MKRQRNGAERNPGCCVSPPTTRVDTNGPVGDAPAECEVTGKSESHFPAPLQILARKRERIGPPGGRMILSSVRCAGSESLAPLADVSPTPDRE